MKNILYITSRSDFGGGPRHVDQLLGLLPPEYAIFMAYPYKGSPYGLMWDKNERVVDRLYIPYRKLSFKALWKLYLFVKQNKIEIVHSHGNGAGVYSRLLKILMPTLKVVHTFHGISDTYKSSFKKVLSFLLGWTLKPFANLYIAVSNGEKTMAINRKFSKKSNTMVVYNGIENPKAQIPKHMHMPIRFVCLSRFDYQKNMDLMLSIIKKTDKRLAQFVLVGDGPDKERLECIAKKENLNVTFTGFSVKPMDFLNEADWYISTSRFEGLPYALIEAASVGLPIIASNVKGNNECVKDGYNGFLFNNFQEAIEKVNFILSKKYSYESFSNNSHEMFEHNFTEEQMISRLERIYERF